MAEPTQAQKLSYVEIIMKLTDVQWFREHAAKMTDRQIAQMLGTTENTVRSRRHRLSIPTFVPPPRPFEQKQILARLVQNHTDEEIGAMYRVSPSVIKRRRATFGLPKYDSTVSVAKVRASEIKPTDSQPLMREMAVMASCPACKMTVALSLFEVKRDLWSPEPNPKIRITEDRQLEHVGCGGIFRLNR